MSALRLASAPVTWGVWERTVDRDDLIPRHLMLEIVRDLGYAGIELGPPGYLGADASEVARVVGQQGLELAGAFAPLRIADEDGFIDDLPFLDATLDVLVATECRGPVVLAGAAGEPHLAGDDLARAAERVERAARRARARGVAAAFHPHLGTCIESPKEVAALLEATDPDVVSLCLDTGHTVVGGGDPVELATTARDRIAHVHLKDVEPRVLERLRSGELTVDQAWEGGLFCPLGEGVVDFTAVLGALHGYAGWTVVEQDRIAVRAADLDAVREVELRNISVAQ